jgi:hypothetical protein
MQNPDKPLFIWFKTKEGRLTGAYDFNEWNEWGSLVYDSAWIGTAEKPGGCIMIDNGKAVAISKLPGPGLYVVTFRNPTAYSKDSRKVLPVNRALDTFVFKYDPA